MKPKKITWEFYFEILRYIEARNVLKMIGPFLLARLYPEDDQEFTDQVLMELDDE